LCQQDVNNTNGINTSVSPTGRDEAKADIMIEGGAATHVCPAWFARDSPMYTLQHGQGPQLRIRVQHTAKPDANSHTHRDSTQHLFNVMNFTS
jgi:hypothetical protein